MHRQHLVGRLSTAFKNLAEDTPLRGAQRSVARRVVETDLSDELHLPDQGVDLRGLVTVGSDELRMEAKRRMHVCLPTRQRRGVGVDERRIGDSDSMNAGGLNLGYEASWIRKKV